MPLPMEICLEDLDLSPDDERYVRCVALPGGEPGLELDHAGVVRWMPEGPCAYGLWVSGDDRLVLLRAEGAGPITVIRGGRSQLAPCDKPVILIDGDLLSTEGRRLLVHVHGETEVVYPPEPMTRSAMARATRAATAAVALGAAALAGGSATAGSAAADVSQEPIEVRSRPPSRPAPMTRLSCAITRQVPGKKGLVLHATCQPWHRIHVGTRGLLIDPKTKKPLKDGAVVLKKVKGDKVVAEAIQLKTATRAKTFQIFVR